MFLSLLEQTLKQRQADSLLRQQATVEAVNGVKISIAGKQLLNFASNDYLGLSTAATGITAMQQGASEFGVGSGASHLICGHQRPHQALNLAIAKFTGRDAALSFSSGYMANLGLLQALASKGDLIIADKLNHASLIDGVKLSGAKSLRYAHLDMAHLEARLKLNGRNKFVVTDGVFSMDGDIAPLKEIVNLCERYQATLIIDDAHGFGVIGEQGKGITEHFGLTQKQVPVYMATLGKALGGYGAFVAGDERLIRYLQQMARTYMFTTAMPAAVASANLANLQQLASSNRLVKALGENITFFKQQCLQVGIKLMPSESAIQPILVGACDKLIKLEKAVRKQGFLIGAVRPPTVAAGSARFRITLSAAHSPAQIQSLVNCLAKIMHSNKEVKA
ncbi:8-amino-7-oxononanoate synthase [Aliikangiella sp. IMCC44653]